ncbi:Jerky -like [Araneus ventricosus]|uniref:Jerky-like n=1 Tax=Araneus ventricosus TaxID=182803 RepID=A0A4Y2AG37_ARAVE|nr:Jerky -like [Araneus ventricosus]
MKDRVTILGCANAAGSHRVKLTLVGKSKKPRCFKNINKTALLVHYMRQESSRMNSSLFSEWFHYCFVPEVKKILKKLKLKKAILLMDNAPAHRDAETLKAENITCIFIPPNTTSILQPMDQGVIESMKRRYRKPKQIAFGSCGNCEEDGVSSWLDYDADDAGFQLMSDDEIIAQVRKPNSDDDNRESDEDEVIETSKISNSDAFECFAKGLMWLEQQTDSDSTELMLLKTTSGQRG